MSNVVYFDSAMYGASPLSQTLGSIIPILDDCLVNGFGQVTLDSVVVADGVATCTRGAGHNLSMIVTGVGPVIRIAGATPTALNGDWRINVTSASQFTFSCPGVSDGTATGTITAKRAPAGWTKEFAGTNKAVYRGNAVTGSGWYFRVNHSVAPATTEVFYIAPYKSMDDIDTGTRMGNMAALRYAQSQAGTALWWVFGDDRTVYVRVQVVGAPPYLYMASFGDFSAASIVDTDNAYVGGQVHLERLVGNLTAIPYSGLTDVTLINLASGCADQVSRRGSPYFILPQDGGIVGAHLPGSRSLTQAWPNALTGQTDVSQILISEGTSPRGIMRGVWAPAHKDSAIPSGAAIQIPGGGTAIKMAIESPAADQRYGAVLPDLLGPW